MLTIEDFNSFTKFHEAPSSEGSFGPTVTFQGVPSMALSVWFASFISPNFCSDSRKLPKALSAAG
ncbi:MAG: hypothetical protein WBZ36_22195 [Candidatus Nitrosopolaris sp.]